MEAWKKVGYAQPKAQEEYTDAESKALEAIAESTATDYKSAQKVSKLMQRNIPSWSTGAEEGMKEWVVRLKWEQSAPSQVHIGATSSGSGSAEGDCHRGPGSTGAIRTS